MKDVQSNEGHWAAREERVDQVDTGEETIPFVEPKGKSEKHEVDRLVEPFHRVEDAPRISIEALGVEGEALLSTSTFAEFVARLKAYEETKRDALLGVSAAEVEVGVAALVLQFERQVIVQGFTSNREVNKGLHNVVEGLGLPMVFELRKHLEILIREEIYRHLVPELTAPITPELVNALNNASTLQDFEHQLFTHLPAARARYILDDLLIIERGAFPETDEHSFSDSDYLPSEPPSMSARPADINRLTREIKERERLLPTEVDPSHVAQLLLDQLFTDDPVPREIFRHLPMTDRPQ